jgi:hypothetical protein
MADQARLIRHPLRADISGCISGKMAQRPTRSRPAGPNKALADHRRRQRSRGFRRLELLARDDDAALLRAVAAALADPAQAAVARAHLLARFAPAVGLKALLGGAPLDGLDLDRPREGDRDIDL